MRKLITLLNIIFLVPALSLTALGSNDDAWLGVYTQTIDEDLKEAFDLESDNGVVIKMVVPDSPADEAGLEQGDIILMVNDEDVDDADDLQELILVHEPGDEVKVKIIGDHKEDVVIVELGERHDDDSYFKAFDYYNSALPKSFSKTYSFFNEKSSNSYMGVRLSSLNVQLGEYFGVEDGHGALIEEVIPESPAEKAGLKAGDVIITVDEDMVEGPSDVTEIISDKEEGDEVGLTVLRERKEKGFSVVLEENPDKDMFRVGTFFPGFDEDFFLSFPKMKGLSQGNFDNHFFDDDNYQNEMDNLREEIKEMKKEVRELKKKLE